MKQLLAIAILALALFLGAFAVHTSRGVSVGGGLTLDQKIEAVKQMIADDEITNAQAQKYSQRLPVTTKDGVTYWVDEYVAPSGKGYQAYVVKSDGSMTSFGMGPEAVARSYDWTAPTPIFINSTSTP